MMNKNFTIKKNDNEEVMYEIIVMYKDENTNKQYMIYTDGLENEEGSLNLFSSLFEEKNGEIIPIEIKDEADKEIIEEIMAQLVIEEIE